MLKLLISFIFKRSLSFKELRILVDLGLHGVAHQYKEHIRMHYKDHRYNEYFEFKADFINRSCFSSRIE
jgi:hypothetical protein